MKTAYPKTLLIAFENITPPNPVDFSTSMRDMAYQYKNRSYKIKPYHLHPGNEVARALNILEREGFFEARCYTQSVCQAKEVLSRAGFRVRWDAKAGRFV